VRSLSTPRALAALSLLTLLALAARLGGIDALLPHAPEEDAYIVQQAALLRAGIEPTDEVGATIWRKYPHLLAGILARLPLDPAEPLTPLEPPTLAAHLEAAGRPHRVGRSLVAAISALAIPLTFVAARAFTGNLAALGAAALFATALLPHYLSQQARPHGPVGSFTLACLVCALAWNSRPRAWLVPAAAAAAALAFATLHNGLAGLPPLAAAWWLSSKRAGATLSLAAPLAIAIGLALALLAGYPFLAEAFGDPSRLGDESTSGHAVDASAFGGRGFAVLFAAVAHNDPLLGAAAAAGLIAGLTRWRELTPETKQRVAICAALGLPYLLAVGLYDKSFERFALPLWPLLAMLALFGANRCGEALGRRMRPLRHAPLIALLAVQVLLCARKLQLDLRPDTFERAAAWFAEDPDQRGGPLLLVARAFPPLPMVEKHTPFGDATWGGLYRIPWREHLLEYPPAEGAWRFQAASGRSEGDRRGIRYADGRLGPALLESVREQMLATGARRVIALDAGGLGGKSSFEELLDGFATLEFTASPFPADPERGADVGYQGESAVRRLVLGQALGPKVQVWRLP
jgi:hypothetical protein